MTSKTLTVPGIYPALVKVVDGSGTFNGLHAVIPPGYLSSEGESKEAASEEPLEGGAPFGLMDKPDFLMQADVFSGNPHHQISKRLMSVRNATDTEAVEMPFVDGLYIIQHSPGAITVDYTTD